MTAEVELAEIEGELASIKVERAELLKRKAELEAAANATSASATPAPEFTEDGRLKLWGSIDKSPIVTSAADEGDEENSGASTTEDGKLKLWGTSTDSKLGESIKEKGGASYYYGHKPQKDSVKVNWNGREEPQRLDSNEPSKTKATGKAVKLKGSAGDHTYDTGYSKWEKFDVTGALKDVDKQKDQKDETFMKSDTFDGAKPGYAFKTAEAGTGYYRDRTKKERKVAPCEPAPQPHDMAAVASSSTTKQYSEGWSGIDDIL